MKRSHARTNYTLLAAAAACAFSAGTASAQTSKYFARQHLPMEKTDGPAQEVNDPFPTSGTPQQQVAWVEKATSQISAAAAQFTQANGRPPESMAEIRAGTGLKSFVLGDPIVDIRYQRSWPWSPRWNTSEESRTWYIAIELTDVFNAFCGAWNATHDDPSILNSNGKCSNYYGNHITKWP